MRELREISFLMNEDKFDGAHVFEGPHNAVRGSLVKAHFPEERIGSVNGRSSCKQPRAPAICLR